MVEEKLTLLDALKIVEKELRDAKKDSVENHLCCLKAEWQLANHECFIHKNKMKCEEGTKLLKEIQETQKILDELR